MSQSLKQVRKIDNLDIKTIFALSRLLCKNFKLIVLVKLQKSKHRICTYEEISPESYHVQSSLALKRVFTIRPHPIPFFCLYLSKRKLSNFNIFVVFQTVGAQIQHLNFKFRSQTRDDEDSDINSNSKKYEIGDLVWAKWKDRKPYGAIILNISETGYVIRYADGVEMAINEDRIEDDWKPELALDEDFLAFYQNLFKKSDEKIIQKRLNAAKVIYKFLIFLPDSSFWLKSQM